MTLDRDSPVDRFGLLLTELATALRPVVEELLATNPAGAGARVLDDAYVDRWLTPSQAAERVGVHRRTIYRALRAGTLVGGQLEAGSRACRWRIRASEVDRWAGARRERFCTPRQKSSPRTTPVVRTNSPDSYRARLKESKP